VPLIGSTRADRTGRQPAGAPGMRVVALGDSLSCGEGVGIHLDPGHTWTALLTDQIPDADLIQLAQPGARVRDVLRRQLPAALTCRPDLATVLVGLNDIIRAGFHPDRFRDDLTNLVEAVAATGATVLVATLHDPGVLRPLPLTPRLRSQLTARVALVNRNVRDLAAERIRVLDLAAIRELRLLGAWEVDRVHPSRAGHRLILAAAVQALAGSEVPTLPTPPAHPIPTPAGRAARARWILAHGFPWLVRHGGRVAPAALAMGRNSSGGDDPIGSRPLQATADEPTLGRARPGVGEHAGAPEVARALG